MMKTSTVPVSLHQRVVQKEGSIESDMDGGRVLLSVRSGKYYNLGEIGGFIWDQLTAPATAARVIDSLLEAYEVDRAVCEAQTLAFLDNMLREGLIVAAGEAADTA